MGEGAGGEGTEWERGQGERGVGGTGSYCPLVEGKEAATPRLWTQRAKIRLASLLDMLEIRVMPNNTPYLCQRVPFPLDLHLHHIGSKVIVGSLNPAVGEER